MTSDSQFAALRAEMVATIALCTQLSAPRLGKGQLDDRVMAAMATVPRHEFVPAPLRNFAYLDCPLPIGHDKTISQPFIVALMTDLLDVRPTDTVLEIGTGLGYHAAILAELARAVYSMEIVEELAESGRRRLIERGYKNIEFKIGDGSRGWPEHAPFDRIIVTAAPELVAPMWISQLKVGGRMVLPAGLEGSQKLLLVTKNDLGNVAIIELIEVAFSPLIVSN